MRGYISWSSVMVDPGPKIYRVEDDSIVREDHLTFTSNIGTRQNINAVVTMFAQPCLCRPLDFESLPKPKKGRKPVYIGTAPQDESSVGRKGSERPQKDRQQSMGPDASEAGQRSWRSRLHRRQSQGYSVLK